MRIAICDDERMVRESFAELIRMKYEFKYYVQSFSSGEDLLSFYMEGNEPFDILFLDIRMKGKSGVEVARYIRSKDSSAVIVFITASENQWADGYEVEAFHFLIKPVSNERFYSVLDGAIDKAAALTNTVLIRIDKEYRREPCSNILYIENDKKDLYFHLYNRNPLKGTGSIKNYSVMLEHQGFIHIYTSFLVNLQHVVSINQHKRLLIMRDGKSLLIARERMQEFLKKYLEYARG